MPMPERNVEGEYPYAFQGQEKDAETGMEAFELRLWDPRIGRWLTTDPAGQHFSPYMGMGNNPISNIDPDGGMTCPNPPCNQGESTQFNFLSGEYELDLSLGFTLDAVDVGFAHNSSISIYGALSNFVDFANGGPLYEYETGSKAPQLIGTFGIAGGAKALSTATKVATQSLSKVDEFANLLKPINEFDTSVTLFRGLNGKEGAASSIFLTDDAAVAATYVKNGLSVHSIKISDFALLKLEQTQRFFRHTGKHTIDGVTSSEFEFVGKELVEAILKLSKPF